MDELNGFIYAVESQEASAIVHINPDTSELLHVQRGLHVAVPGGEGASVPLEAPGEVVSCDAAVALAALAVDALVGHTDVRSLPADVYLEVVPPQVEALCGQDLAPALKALRYIGIRMLPGRGVSHLPVFFCQAQEFVGRVRVETHVGGIWGRIAKKYWSTVQIPRLSPRPPFCYCCLHSPPLHRLEAIAMFEFKPYLKTQQHQRIK